MKNFNFCLCFSYAPFRRVVSCGVLETPRFGRKLSFNFMPGAKVSFECNEGFVLVGDQRRECMSNGLWNIPDYGYTICLRKSILYRVFVSFISILLISVPKVI